MWNPIIFVIQFSCSTISESSGYTTCCIKHAVCNGIIDCLNEEDDCSDNYESTTEQVPSTVDNRVNFLEELILIDSSAGYLVLNLLLFVFVCIIWKLPEKLWQKFTLILKFKLWKRKQDWSVTKEIWKQPEIFINRNLQNLKDGLYAAGLTRFPSLSYSG